MVIHLPVGLPLRLAGGNTRQEGRLEILINGEWGTICDDDWDLEDAQVACRQLGFPDAMEATGRAYFGSGTGPIYLDEVECIGNETDLTSCGHNGIGVHDCNHGEDAGIVCGPSGKNKSM